MIRQVLTSIVVITGVLVLAELAEAWVLHKPFALPHDFPVIVAAAVVASLLVGQMKLGRR